MLRLPPTGCSWQTGASATRDVHERIAIERWYPHLSNLNRGPLFCPPVRGLVVPTDRAVRIGLPVLPTVWTGDAVTAEAERHDDLAWCQGRGDEHGAAHRLSFV